MKERVQAARMRIRRKGRSLAIGRSSARQGRPKNKRVRYATPQCGGTLIHTPPQPLPVVEFTAEQVERIVSSDNFVSFVDRTSRLVERALSGPSDILFDYITANSVENG